MTNKKPTSFFKYYNANATISVLETKSARWTRPTNFNDPFDSQLDLLADPNHEQLASKICDLVEGYLFHDKDIKGLDEEVALQIADLKKLIKETGVSIDKEKLKKVGAEGVENLNQELVNINAEVKKLYSHLVTFCMSDIHDSLLMWAHYGDNHKGAVIEFTTKHKLKTPLKDIGQVQYSDTLPYLEFEDIFDSDRIKDKLAQLVTTKSTDWAYEQEWRVVDFYKNPDSQYKIWKFNKNEIKAVYLGYRMNEPDKKHIMSIIKKDYPHISVYQAEKHPSEFKLSFVKIM